MSRQNNSETGNSKLNQNNGGFSFWRTCLQVYIITVHQSSFGDFKITYSGPIYGILAEDEFNGLLVQVFFISYHSKTHFSLSKTSEYQIWSRNFGFVLIQKLVVVRALVKFYSFLIQLSKTRKDSIHDTIIFVCLHF